MIPFILSCFFFLFVFVLVFFPLRSLSDFSLRGISQQRDEQEEIWEQSVSAACLVDQEEIIRHKHMDRQRDGFTRFEIIGVVGEDSSWLFTRHCHYLIKQLPAAAPPQADSETAVFQSASTIHEKINQHPVMTLKIKVD